MTYPTNLAPRCFGRALSEPVRCRPSLHLPSTYPSLHTIQPHTRARQVTAHGTRSVIRLHNPSTSTSSTRGFTSPQSSLTRLLRQSLAEKPTCPYSTQKEDETKQDFRGGKKYVNPACRQPCLLSSTIPNLGQSPPPRRLPTHLTGISFSHFMNLLRECTATDAFSLGVF